MEVEKQNGIIPGASQNTPGTPKRSRSPSPSGIDWKVKNHKMPKHKPVGRQNKIFGSVSEDDIADSTISSPLHLDDQVLEPPPLSPSPQKTDHHRTRRTVHKANSYGAIEETLDTGVLKKRLSSLFKHGKTSGFKRQDSDLGYQSQGSPLSPLPSQHELNGHVSNGVSSGVVHRDLSIEEELENRLMEVTCVARQWKTRWRQEKDANHHIQEQFNSCERECYLLIDNLQETYEEHLADLEIKLEKSQEQHKQLHLQKSQVETELRKVINDANKESTKFKQELESVQKEVASLSDHMKKLKETNKKLEKDIEEKTVENQHLSKELIEEKKKVSDSLKVANYDIQSKVKTAEMQTELYKSLLDIALNKLKFLEEQVSLGCGDVTGKRPSIGNGDARRRLSAGNDDIIGRAPVSKGRYILRVNSNDPTDMFVEDSVTSGHNHDAVSVSSEDQSSSKRTSVCSSVNMSEVLGSETNLPSMSSLGSSMKDEDVFGSADISGSTGTESYCTYSLPHRKRASSEGGPSDFTEPTMRPRTSSTVGSPPRERSLVSPSGFESSIGQLVKSSSETITGMKTNSRSSKFRRSVENVSSAPLSMESDISLVGQDKHEETKSSRITTLREIKRKRSDSYKASFPSESTIQRLHKYRSLGDLIKGITGEKRRSWNKEETSSFGQESNHSTLPENQNNNNRPGKAVPPLIKSRTMGEDNMQPKLLKALNRRTSYDTMPSSERKTALSREPSDVSMSSLEVKLSKSSSTDDVHDAAGTRASGFGVLRSRRNGLIADAADFKDISKQLRKKQKSGRDFSDILKKLSRDNSDDTRDDVVDYKPHRRRSKNK